jgi:hypothetical protein
MGQRASAEEIAGIARSVNPEDVRPIPYNLPQSADELPTSIMPMEVPGNAGRAPKRPTSFTDHLKSNLRAEGAARGGPVRIDAEDAINNGVPAELIYKNPDVVDKAQLQLRNPSLFGTRYGRMSGKEQVLRSLDMDKVDPAQWGFDDRIGGRLGPEDVGDLLRRDLEGDPSALRRGGAYDAWTAHQDRAASKAEFEGRYPDGPPVEQRGEIISFDDLQALTPHRRPMRMHLSSSARSAISISTSSTLAMSRGSSGKCRTASADLILPSAASSNRRRHGGLLMSWGCGLRMFYNVDMGRH